MYRRLALLCAFTALVFVAASSENVAVRELAPGVFFWQGDHIKKVPANCTWIVFRDYILVIDANFPQGAKEIIPLIHKTSPKPIRFVFDTHWHADHTGGNAVYTEAGATIVCSQPCAEDLRTKNNAAKVAIEPASLSFAEKMVFDDGSRRVELTLMGPAHSRGDAVAYLPKEKILVTGDLCVNWTWGNNVGDADANFDNWIKALDTLSKWDAKIVVPGHGSLGTIATMQAQRGYLSDMLQKVKAGLRAGKSAEDVAKQTDLSGHGSFGANAESNAGSIRAMCRKLSQ